MDKKILALDLGTKMGWATNSRTVVDVKIKPDGSMTALNDSTFLSGHEEWDDSGISGWKYYAFKRWLDARLNEFEIEHIIYEETFSVGFQAARILHGFQAMVQYVYAKRYPLKTKFTLSTVHPMTLKKFATGSGKATKEAMQDAAKQRFGWRAESYDEVDALWILEYKLKGGKP